MTVNDAERQSWIEVRSDSDFPIQNLPFGVAALPEGRRIVSRIGDVVVNLHQLSERGYFKDVAGDRALREPALNQLFAQGRPAIRSVRERLSEILGNDGAYAADAGVRDALVPAAQTQMTLPGEIGDYVDFYSSLEHATNLGRLFRPDAEPLLPNWRWLPIGYHGRSGTIVVDGTPIARPNGQRKAPSDAAPSFGPTRQLDIELEMGFFAAAGNALGQPIAAADAPQHVAGLVLVNDWSARDVQAWEYQPLGPFLGKSFATTISPWVVTLDALEPFAVAPPVQNPPPLPYLHDAGVAYDVQLSVELQTAAMRDAGIAPVQIARTTFGGMYWTIAQQLAHATVNGAVARPGDLFASGTISGSDTGSYGSFIELTWRGTRPLTLPSGETRAFLEDGDEVILRGWCERPGARRIGFGCARGRIVPAPS